MSIERRRPARRLGQRGVSLTVFTAVVMVVLLLVIGLVVDGGERSAAQRRAETIASSAARAGVDASSGDQLSGASGAAAAITAARAVVASSELAGTVSVEGDRITVRVESQVRTNFLSLIGINELPVRASSSATLRSAAP